MSTDQFPKETSFAARVFVSHHGGRRSNRADLFSLIRSLTKYLESYTVAQEVAVRQAIYPGFKSHYDVITKHYTIIARAAVLNAWLPLGLGVTFSRRTCSNVSVGHLLVGNCRTWSVHLAPNISLAPEGDAPIPKWGDEN